MAAFGLPWLPSDKRLLLTPNSSFESIRGTVLAAGTVPQRWWSALLGAAERRSVGRQWRAHSLSVQHFARLHEMTALVLYGSRESGHSYKVKLALTLLGLSHEYREVDLNVPLAQRSTDFRDVSPFGEVPALVWNGGSLVQSNAILAHLAQSTGRLGGQLAPDLVSQWLFWEANRIGFSVPNLRAVLTYARETPSQVGDWLRARAVADLARLDLDLRSSPYLLGSDVTVVDIACCAYLFWPEQAGLHLAEWPNVSRWLDRIRLLPGWAAPYDLLK